MSMKISIITPAFNSVQTISRTMDAVSGQTVPPFEYIIVDGGSSDGTVELARNHDATTMVISEPDEGIADAFNKGIMLAQGDVIGIINADDWYEPDALEHCLRCFEGSSDKIDVMHGLIRYWSADCRTEVFFPNEGAMLKEMTMNHPTVFVRRAAYEKWGSFLSQYRYAMDYELLLRFMIGGARFEQVDAVISNMSRGGVSDTEWYKAYAEVAKIKCLHIGRPVDAWSYYCYQVLRTGLSRALCCAGLGNIVTWWRSKLSIMKKKHC